LLKIKKKNFISFDSTIELSSREIEIKKNDIHDLKQVKSNLIARGSGLSYSLISASEEAISIKLKQKEITLNINKKSILISSDYCLGEATKYLMERGYRLHVLPGHPNITIGGAIACDVHGKSQNKFGNFGNYVKSIKLYHPDKGFMACSKDLNCELFELTIGGYGMTGIIVEAEVEVKKLNSFEINTTKQLINNLSELKSIYKSKLDNYEGVYSWHDLNDIKKFGKGFIFYEKINNKLGKNIRIKSTSISNKKPHKIWELFAYIYGKFQNTFFYYYNYLTLYREESNNFYYSNFSNKKQIYFKVLRSSGFIEKQMIVPIDKWEKYCNFLETNIKNLYCFLCVCKFSYTKKKFLRFSGEGISIALNFKKTDKSVEFCKKLDKFCENNEILLCIYKDSLIQRSTIKKIFGNEYIQFCKLLHKYDKNRLFISNMSKKFNL